MTTKRLFTSESVSAGHPDKIADQISDAILDAYYEQDENTRAGIEVMVKDFHVVIGGEIKSTGNLTQKDLERISRGVYRQIGYDDSWGLDPNNLVVTNLLGVQSPEISSGVDKENGDVGAGDQGIMFGYSHSSPLKDGLPPALSFAHSAIEILDEMYSTELGPDIKSQVTVDEDTGLIDTVVISALHRKSTSLKALREDLTLKLSEAFAPFLAPDATFLVNPAGAWHVGGPISDAGITGRKIVVDGYGGYCPEGGGASSGKDMSKVDRSARYKARQMANTIREAYGLKWVQVQLAYAIGVAEPVSVNIKSSSPRMVQSISDRIISSGYLKDHCVPSAIIRDFKPTSGNWFQKLGYRHFSRSGLTPLPWEVSCPVLLEILERV